MKSREAGIGVCGVVVGIILGAGALLYTNDYGVRAELAGALVNPLVAFRGMDMDIDRRYFKKRAVNERYESAHPPAPLKEETPSQRPRYPSQEEIQPAVSSECSEGKKLKDDVLAMVPSTEDYLRLRSKIALAFNEVMKGCPSQQAKTQTKKSAGVSPTPRVNNACEQYGRGTQRYTRCLVNERRNQRYEGRQTQPGWRRN